MSWLGIDFSGNADQWGPRRKTSNVWIARLSASAGGYALIDLCRVQSLQGPAHPFDRLCALLRSGNYRAAAIDAPFSIPRGNVPTCHQGLLAHVVGLPRQSRPFADARTFVTAVAGAPPLVPPKPLRFTEQLWRNRGLNVRSTLWAGPRGGAPMTAACLTLLAAAARPIWPFAHSEGMLVEAFPMAQLEHWGLPYESYSATGSANLNTIVAGLNARVELGKFQPVLLASADATDAVLAAFAAIAVDRNRLSAPPTVDSAFEGWIATHV